MRVTIIPSDRLVIVDGVPVVVEAFPQGDPSWHAIQVDDGKAVIERSIGDPLLLDEAETTALLSPYLAARDDQIALPPPVPGVPPMVTKLQLFDALDQMSMSLDALVSQLPEKDRRRFELAVQIHRSDPSIAMLAAGLGWTTQDVDNLFLLAATL